MGITCYLTDLFAAEIERSARPAYSSPTPLTPTLRDSRALVEHINCNVAFSIEASVDFYGEMQYLS